MQPVTIAIADADRNRRAMYEQSWRNASDVRLLANVSMNDQIVKDRRLKPRNNISVIDDEVARAKRLVPRVLLVNMNLCPDEDYSILQRLHSECPSIYVVLMGDAIANDDLIIKALECGARGYVSHETVDQDLARVASAIDRGEAWVSRKVLGKLINQIQNHEMH